MIFELNAAQMDRLEAWQAEMRLIRLQLQGDEGDEFVYDGAIGGAYEYVFQPTSIGTFITVRELVTKRELDLTVDL